MGKRGGKRRHRATQWMEKNTTSTEEDSVHKTPKLVEPSPTSSPSFHDASEQMEVSLVGVVDSSSPLPPPFSFNEAQETSDISSPSSLYPKEHVFPPDHNCILQLWKNLSHNKWELSKIQQYLWALLFYSSWNIIGVAPTGSGKTLSYAVPTVLSQSAILVLVPTRELAQQVAKVFAKVCKASHSTSTCSNNNNNRNSNKRHQYQQHQHQYPIVCIHGGANRRKQQEELEAASTTGTAIVVATPGRYLDLTQSTRLIPVFSWIVLDEADQLAKEGDLGPQVDQIIETSKLPSTRLVLVSATNPEKAQERFQTWVGKEHALVQVNHHVQPQSQAQPLQVPQPSIKMEVTDSSPLPNDHDSTSTTTPTTATTTNTTTKDNNNAGTFSKIPSHLEQVLHVCAEHKKPRKLLHTLQQIYKSFPNQRNRPLGIVFFSKIEKLKYISKLLEKEGVTGSVELHSQLPSTKVREAHLAQFACGQKPLLLATDVAARGIDIPHVHFVIQYDFPGNLQQYIHRCGRAGRSSSKSDENGSHAKPTIYSFFTRNLKPLAMDLIRLLEAHNAWVDPNLRALANEEKPNSRKHAKKTRADDENDDDDEPVDDFPELAPNRIVLKRASHVSDASSSEDESDNDNK